MALRHRGLGTRTRIQASTRAGGDECSVEISAKMVRCLLVEREVCRWVCVVAVQLEGCGFVCGVLAEAMRSLYTPRVGEPPYLSKCKCTCTGIGEPVVKQWGRQWRDNGGGCDRGCPHGAIVRALRRESGRLWSEKRIGGSHDRVCSYCTVRSEVNCGGAPLKGGIVRYLVVRGRAHAIERAVGRRRAAGLACLRAGGEAAYGYDCTARSGDREGTRGNGVRTREGRLARKIDGGVGEHGARKFSQWWMDRLV